MLNRVLLCGGDRPVTHTVLSGIGGFYPLSAGSTPNPSGQCGDNQQCLQTLQSPGGGGDELAPVEKSCFKL